MILGMPVSTFTLVHVILSLIGIAAGIVVLFAMWAGNRIPGITAVFLITTILTSVTGFFFHSAAFGPPHVVGVISLVVLLFSLLGLYVYRLAGHWRWIYVSSATFALYLNTFVGVVQAFQKIPFLNQFAPQGNEPPFAVAQGLVLVLFALAGWRAVKKFHPVADGVARGGQTVSLAAKLE